MGWGGARRGVFPHLRVQLLVGLPRSDALAPVPTHAINNARTRETARCGVTIFGAASQSKRASPLHRPIPATAASWLPNKKQWRPTYQGRSVTWPQPTWSQQAEERASARMRVCVPTPRPPACQGNGAVRWGGASHARRYPPPPLGWAGAAHPSSSPPCAAPRTSSSRGCWARSACALRWRRSAAAPLARRRRSTHAPQPSPR